MSESSGSVRLSYLEGLRGCAALLVLLEHTYLAMRFWSQTSPYPHHMISLMQVFNMGQLPVDIFIVLSGYCLMLPVASSKDGHLRGGMWSYLKRRSWRILPPYYFALFVSMVLLAVLAAIDQRLPQVLHTADFRIDVLLSHLLLIHNLSPNWLYGVNGPMWSVATEWQIYFVFPLFLLPIWRRFGMSAAVVSGLAIGLAPHWLFHGYFDPAFPWYIGLFAMGMAGAVINYGNNKNCETLRGCQYWGALSLALWVGAVGTCLLKRGFYAHHQMIADPIIGLATMCLIIGCTEHFKRGGSIAVNPVPRFLNAAPVVWLGTFSYSLYLMHYPLLHISHALVTRIPIGAMGKFAVLIASLPLIVSLCFGFHLLFERRYMHYVPATRAFQPKPDNSTVRVMPSSTSR